MRTGERTLVPPLRPSRQSKDRGRARSPAAAAAAGVRDLMRGW